MMKLEDIKIGGHTAPTLLDMNQYQGPMGAYMELLGLIEGPTENEPMKWGTAAEHVVARRYAKETGTILLPSVDEGYDRFNPFVHPQYSWWTGTPDRLVEPDGGLEIKIVGERSAHQWTEDEVPDMYLIQCHWYLGLFPDRLFWDLAVQIGNRDYRVYRINRDEEMLETLRIAAEDFINNHLIPEIPPPIDGSESSRKFLNIKYPAETEPLLESAGNIELWVDRLRNVKAEKADIEKMEAELENQIKDVIGNHAGIQGTWGKILWKKNKDTRKIDHKSILDDVAAYVPADVFHDAEDKHTIIKPGARVFRTYFKED